MTEFHCDGRVIHPLPGSGQARLSVVLEETGAHAEPRLHESTPCPIAYQRRQMLYAPAGLQVWGFSAHAHYVKDATLEFDFGALSERLSSRLDACAAEVPRLRFVDDRIWGIVRLLAEVVDDPDPSMQLYGDGLTAVLAAQLFLKPAEVASPATARLAPWQLRRVLDYLETSLPDHVTLGELASLVGLSQWHFSRAFKASTGLAPYRWQLEARIRRAQSLLLGTQASLDAIAEATGFADAVHFGKTFRRIAGTAPATWRRERKS
ncbi:helix-turn-helix domain-containing protein [Acidovorax sp.]|uniref:AraC family transcriptional regulator n=1 Tax=Acidovorax sp. TaxID=1872122 RepID=UPI00391F9F6B